MKSGEKLFFILLKKIEILVSIFFVQFHIMILFDIIILHVVLIYFSFYLIIDKYSMRKFLLNYIDFCSTLY